MFEQQTPQNPQPQGTMPPQPKAEDIFVGVDRPSTSSMPKPQEMVVETKGGFNLKILIVGLVIVLLLAMIGFSAWFFLFRSAPVVETEPQPTTEEPAPVESFVPAPEAPETPEMIVVPEGASAEEAPVEESPAQPVDTDGDGLEDAREFSLGTNPNSPDTDGDGLFDKEEVDVYRTSPLNPDTDGDTFGDGTEVRSGYNPNGAGRLFQVPQ